MEILKKESIVKEVAIVYVEKEILLSIIEKLTTTVSLSRSIVKEVVIVYVEKARGWTLG